MPELVVLDVRADEVWPGDRLSEAELVLSIHLTLEQGLVTAVRLEIARNGDDYLRRLMDEGDPRMPDPERYDRELEPAEQLRVARAGHVTVRTPSGAAGELLPLWYDDDGNPAPRSNGKVDLHIGGKGFLSGVFDPSWLERPDLVERAYRDLSR